MTHTTFRRRDFALAGLLALSPLLAGPAEAKLKIVSGGKKSSGGSTSTDTSSSTTTTTTTTSSSTSSTTTKTSTSLSCDTCSYGTPVLDSYGRASFTNRLWGLQRDTSKSYPIEQSTDSALRRHRFELRNGDSWNNESDRNRSEYSCTTRESNGREVWFSYAMRVQGGAPVSDWNILGQFHSVADPGESNGSPPFAFCLVPGEKLRILKRTDPNPLSTTSPKPTIMYERVIGRDRWYRFVGRIVFGWANNGACEVWMDGVKVVNLPITNIGYNDLMGPYWKFGVYRAAVPDTLVVEYANMEIGATSLLSRVTSPLALA